MATVETLKTVPKRANKGEVKWKSGICGICPAGCWVEVGVREGKMEAIRPDGGPPPGHDLQVWGACARDR